jgi:hypothetical protein
MLSTGRVSPGAAARLTVIGEDQRGVEILDAGPGPPNHQGGPCLYLVREAAPGRFALSSSRTRQTTHSDVGLAVRLGSTQGCRAQ